MTRGEIERPHAPGKAPAGGRRADRAWASLAPAVVATLVLMIPAGPAHAGRPGDLPEGTIAEIRFEGNQSIPSEQIRDKIKSRAGRPLDKATIEQDHKALEATKWFSAVRVVYDTAAEGKGFILIFQVDEMPILRDVQFVGRNKIKLKDIEETTGLKKGARADSVRARLAVQQIQTLYEEKGYEKAEVRLIEGGGLGDTRVIIEIFEGPKFKVDTIDFVGNTFVEDAVLSTKIESRRGFLGLLGAKRFKDGVENDKRALVKYYTDNGFFDVQISPTTRPGSSLGEERITFTISEGPQYKVRKVVFEGNKKLPEAKLAAGLMLKPGEPYNEGLRELDYKAINNRYWEIGCIDTRIEKDQPPTEQPGFVDVVYKIEEGEPFLLGRIIVRGNARTKEKVVRREALMAGLVPGEKLDLNRMETFKKRLTGTGYFVSNPQMGKAIDIQVVNKRPGDKPFGDDVAFDLGGVIPARMQGPDPDGPPPGRPQLPPMSDLGRLEAVGRRRGLSGYFAGQGPSRTTATPRPAALAPAPEPVEQARLQSPEQDSPPAPGEPPQLPPLDQPPALDPPAGPGGPTVGVPFGAAGDLFAPPVNTIPPVSPAPSPPATPAGPLPPAARGGATDPGLFPNLPNNNMTNPGPDRNEPFANRSYADIVANIDEAPTGRLMFGIGASSFGGLMGNVILHESNFDLFAIPRSFSELTSGRAFRGAGQEFRLELSPGTLVQRYMLSFRDPYLFDLPIGLGVSLYQTSRYYPDFSERRAGGRLSLGYQFGPQTYADVAARVEDVDIHGFKYPAPAALLAAAGHTTLATIRPSFRFDNRNNPTAPSKGSYVEAAFEQILGTFSAPKLTLEGRQHFTTGSRPDGSGKRTLTARGFFGVTGRDTPIYERFFAGDFRSMRGFYYRGVGPHILGVNTGGVLTAIGSVEYQFPWNASDTFQQVFFCDFGTVEANYSISTVRAAVGTGVRVVIPQITGQLPLAFDIAFPISKAEGDRVKYFSFFIGAFW